MTKLITEPVRTLVPVHGVHGCAGFLLHSFRGWKAFDPGKKEVGTFETAQLGAEALLERATIDA